MYKPKKPYVCFPHMHSTLILSNSHMCGLKLVETQRLQHPKSKSKYFIVPPAIHQGFIIMWAEVTVHIRLHVPQYCMQGLKCMMSELQNFEIMKIYQWKITTIFFSRLVDMLGLRLPKVTYQGEREQLIKNVTSRFLCVVSAWTGLLRVSTKTLII